MSVTFQKELLTPLEAKILELRKERGLSPTEVALMTNLSLKTILGIESGQPAAYKKCRQLLLFYGKKLEINIADLA